MSLKPFQLDLRILLLVPLFTYLASYFYLAYYHNRLWLLNTVVHEGGTYAFWQDLLYASHFLGHIPIHVMLSLILVGSYLSLTHSDLLQKIWAGAMPIGLVLFLFVSVSIILSCQVFGTQDTWDFISQQKQSVITYGEGGPWNLHIPNSMLLFALIPVYVFSTKMVFGQNIHGSANGLLLISAALAIFLLVTFLVNQNVIPTILSIWQTPRYLAHSVRELATFPLTYFPLPLYFMLRNERVPHKTPRQVSRRLVLLVAVLSIGFALGLAYQASVSFSHGAGNLAQKPTFAKGGQLGVPYLLASHYFEHFLDTVFFLLFTLFVFNLTHTWFKARNRDF
jgi:hypothetical protein